MLRFDEVEEEVFFDTAESFSSSVVSFVVNDREELGFGCGAGYDIWLELKSVKERRQKFLVDMGFIDASCIDVVVSNESESMEIDRIVEYNRAVTSYCGSSVEEDLVCCDRREDNGEANCLAQESVHEWMENLSVNQENETAAKPCFLFEQSRKFDYVYGKKMKNWLRSFLPKTKKNKVVDASADKTREELTRLKVQQNKKKYMEFTGVYTLQEISAHNGQIWTMKFSPDGQYLASGGEDGIVRVWTVSSVDSPINFQGHKKDDDNINGKKSSNSSVLIPDKVFRINNSPVHEFHGHASDVLDLAWSTSNVS